MGEAKTQNDEVPDTRLFANRNAFLSDVWNAYGSRDLYDIKRDCRRLRKHSMSGAQVQIF